MAKANSDQNFKPSADAYVTQLRMHGLLIRRCIADSEKSSESRFVSRRYSASMIIL
jgi:hypothetical protein